MQTNSEGLASSNYDLRYVALPDTVLDAFSTKLLNMQQKLRIVGKSTSELHGAKVRVELQNCVSGAAGDIEAAFLCERHSPAVFDAKARDCREHKVAGGARKLSPKHM